MMRPGEIVFIDDPEPCTPLSAEQRELLLERFRAKAREGAEANREPAR